MGLEPARDLLQCRLDTQFFDDLLQNLDQLLRHLDAVLLVDLGKRPGAFAVLLEVLIVNLRQLEPGAASPSGPDVGRVDLHNPRRASDQGRGHERSREGKGGELHDRYQRGNVLGRMQAGNGNEWKKSK
jgi:hypothetical protein